MDGLLAAFAAASKSYFYPAVCAVTEIGLCGENAAAQMRANGTGLGSFHTYFMDAVSLMTGEQLQGGQKIEIPTKYLPFICDHNATPPRHASAGGTGARGAGRRNHDAAAP